MKKIISVILILTLCLGLWACSGGDAPSQQNTEPEVTIDPNAEPEIVIDPDSVKQNPLDTNSEQTVCYFRTVEGTNCGVPGVVSVEYLDANENVLHTFSPQLPGGTMSAGGNAAGKTRVTERAGNRVISYIIDTETGKLLYCEHSEVNDKEYTCNRIDLYSNNGQFAVSVEVTNEGHSLLPTFYFDQQENLCFVIDELFNSYEMDDGNFHMYYGRTLYYVNQNLVVEILGEPVTSLTAQWNIIQHRKVEVKNGHGNVIAVYEANSENSCVDAGFNSDDNMISVREKFFDDRNIRQESFDLTTGTKLSSETNTYNEDGILVCEETTRWTQEGVTSYHCVTTYDASGKQTGDEIEFRGGKVITTNHATYSALYIKAEFYDTTGTLKKTVEPVDGSICFTLTHYREDQFLITFYDNDGNEIDYDSYRP